MRSLTAILALLGFSITFVAGLASAFPDALPAALASAFPDAVNVLPAALPEETSKSEKSAKNETFKSEQEAHLFHDIFDSAVEEMKNLSDYVNTLYDQGWFLQDLNVGKIATKLSRVFDRLNENAVDFSYLESVFNAKALIRVARKEFEADNALYQERLKTGEVKQLDEKLYDALCETMEERIQDANHASS